MKRLPAPSTTTLVGMLRLADVAGPPSPLKPSVPFPATVLMIPAIVTEVVANLLGSATLVTVTETVAGAGITAGAVYSPDADTVPTIRFPPLTPFTLHVTAVFAVPETV